LESTLAGICSILYSADTIAGICIYFVPKLIISNCAGTTSSGMTTVTSQLPSSATHQTRDNTQSRRNSTSTAIDAVAEEHTQQKAEWEGSPDND
jgi:hypothetical protein